VLKNEDALDKWAEISVLYDGFDFVSAGDSGLIARYCMTYAEYLDLIVRRKRIDGIVQDSDDVFQYLDENDADFNWRIRKKLMDMCSTGAVLNIDTAINKKMEMLIKMEDRLFLNPLAKVKNVPKKQEEKPQDPMQRAGFGDV
jgi:phage terminase small subunit